MEVFAFVLVVMVTLLFGLMAVVPLLIDATPVRPTRPVAMAVVVRNDGEREPVQVA